ncbi:hypothetical protein K445DRAFT_317135 [Daldinia sp. EC12]|nr:hypothetical protein K445DRAFT_322940 [Daldinia sp. EC12]OTB16146.1 hypothetical protein K445DRAFT_317135 [Daldinia sp. EC12]
MPRPKSDIDNFQDEIIARWSVGESIDDIFEYLTTEIAIGKRTLERRLSEWQLFRYQSRTTITPDILDKIRYLTFHHGYKDVSIIRDLGREGIHLSPRALQFVRLKHGIKRRYRTDEERNEVLAQARRFIENHSTHSTSVRSYGRSYLYNFVRSQAGLLVGKNRIYQIYKEIYPEEVQQRRRATWINRTDFQVPGPNFLWSLDGYAKLADFGFQIYGCIDAYSRLIIWIYVGRSATTAISTLKQYLRTILTAGVRPCFTRADHGVETPLWAGAQATLADQDQSVITYKDEQGVVHQHRQGTRLSSVHLMGPSTRNIKIESWWRLFRSGSTDRWIAFKSELINNGLFIPNDKCDQIAVYAIYGPILRKEFAEFVQIWNSHTIRKQKTRPHVRPGIPYDLYNTDVDADWGFPIKEGAKSYEAAKIMYSAVENIEIDDFMTPETTDWCEEQLEIIGYNGMLNANEDQIRPHLQIYLELRDIVRYHVISGEAPHLELIQPPTGGTEAYIQLLDLLRNNHPVFANENLRGDEIPQEIAQGIQGIQEEDYYINDE